MTPAGLLQKIQERAPAGNNRRLVAAFKVALWLIFASLAALAAGELWLRPERWEPLIFTRGCQLAFIVAAVGVLDRPWAIDRAVPVTLCIQAFLCASIAAAGIIGNDVMTPVLLFMVYQLSAGALFGWSVQMQGISVAISALAILFNATVVTGGVTAFGYGPIIGVLTGFGVSLYSAFDRARYRRIAAGYREERQRAVEALRHSEVLFRSLIVNASDIVVVLDMKGTFQYVGPSVERRLGYLPEELVGMSMLQIIHPEDAAAVVDAVGKLLVDEGDRPAAVEYRCLHKDGTWRVLVASGKPFVDESGARTIVVNAHDITERKQAERVKDELLSTVSHELRTPLTSLRGFAELMLKREFPVEKQREFLSIIHSESLRLTNLINDFLDLQRMEAGRQHYAFTRLDLFPLLRDAIAVFAQPNAGHALRVDVADSTPAVHADPERVHQVLTNLLSNAVKFSPTGGEIVVGACRDGDEVVVRVADAGLGIPAEALPNLFGKFFRVDNRATRSIGGTGLGLALVKQIVEAHKGRVWVESEPGKGSTFFFTLPVA